MLSSAQHDGLFAFLEILIRGMQLKNVSFALGGSTLVGSLSRHDILPGDSYISLIVDKNDKQKLKESCALFDPNNELLRPKLYHSQSLLSWLTATKAKPKVSKIII